MVTKDTIKIMKKISREACLDANLRTRVAPKNAKKVYSRKEKHKKPIE